MFSEVYSAYFNAVAAILREVLRDGGITEKRMADIINEKAFSESFLAIIPALKNEEWLLINSAGRTPVRKPPRMPLTLLQKRWMKALLEDPRIALFAPDVSGLEGVEPLFRVSDFVYFDRYADGDPYEDENYRVNFQTILQALRERRALKISYLNRNGRRVAGTYRPWKLEYSAKDDKFRLLTSGGYLSATINLGRITACTLLDRYDPSKLRETRREASITFELTDERKALERVMLHFSDCRKETRRGAAAGNPRGGLLEEPGLGGRAARKEKADAYNVTLWYDPQDETEMVIRVLSFGQMVRVVSPDSFVELVRARVLRQQKLLACSE